MSQYYGYNGPSRGIPFQMLIAGAIVLFGLISYFGRTSLNPITHEKQHVKLSPQEEVQLGLQSAPSMAQEMGGEIPNGDPRTEEVQLVGLHVVQNSDAGKATQYRFQFHLLADPKTINAFALPGGQIFITRGLLDRLSNEAQLAGVLGHESGHVVARHTSEQLAKTDLMQSLVMAVGVAASDSNHPGRGYSAQMIAGVVAQIKQLQYSRGDESQADELGLQFMSEAGYDPRAMIQVMQILEQSSPSSGQSEFMQTHPNPEHRIEDIDAWIKKHYPAGVPSNLTNGGLVEQGMPARR
ncbi:MAG TPA: M48 family metallopeptidase [Humisphaera sp.]|jgi:predicted Zn-dependent protease|nr:M48 family metallopeptidase [Humisphaera sp.]